MLLYIFRNQCSGVYELLITPNNEKGELFFMFGRCGKLSCFEEENSQGSSYSSNVSMN